MTAFYGVRYKRIMLVLKRDLGDSVPMFMHRYWLHAKRLVDATQLTTEYLSASLSQARRSTSERFLKTTYS